MENYKKYILIVIYIISNFINFSLFILQTGKLLCFERTTKMVRLLKSIIHESSIENISFINQVRLKKSTISDLFSRFIRNRRKHA